MENLDDDGLLYGGSAVMPTSIAGLGLAMYNAQWSTVAHLPNIKVIYALIHNWVPDFQSIFWKICVEFHYTIW